MPLTVMISVGQRKGHPKDTLRNAQETGEFVINIVNEELAAAMNETSGEWAYEVNEFDRAGVTPAASIDVTPPRVAEAPIALECKVTQIVPGDRYDVHADSGARAALPHPIGSAAPQRRGGCAAPATAGALERR